FLLCIVFAGILQILFGVFKLGFFAEVLPKIYVGPELSEGLIIVLPLRASTIFAIIDKVSKPIKEKIT
ncbi:hypothetical protein, partial [Acinetobacter baumannii]|uniref:hypothetical protein n=1 Tax=Acinetobacter baumannii TaxID=470 RepID=UPI00192C7D6C